MADHAGPRDEIINLWPTLFANANLPGHETPTAELRALALAGDLEGDLLESGHDCARWLDGHVRRAAQAWFRKAGAAESMPWRARGFLEVLRLGDYRELANDPGAKLSGFYFVDEPGPPELDHLRADCLPSRVTFYDPRVAFNSLAVEGDPYFTESFTVQPRSGLLMLWPSYVRLFTRVHVSRRPWVRVRLRVEAHPKRAESTA